MKLSILFLFLFLFSSSIFAAKFGVVDVQKVLRYSKPSLNARSELEKKVKKLEDLVKSRKKDLEIRMGKV